MPYPRVFLAQPATQAPSPRSDSEQTTVALITRPFKLVSTSSIPEDVSAFPTCVELYIALRLISILSEIPSRHCRLDRRSVRHRRSGCTGLLRGFPLPSLDSQNMIWAVVSINSLTFVITKEDIWVILLGFFELASRSPQMPLHSSLDMSHTILRFLFFYHF